MIFRDRGNPGLNKSDNLKRKGRRGSLEVAVNSVSLNSDDLNAEVAEDAEETLILGKTAVPIKAMFFTQRSQRKA